MASDAVANSEGAAEAPRCGAAWNWANPLPQGNGLRAVTYAPGFGYLAVGDKGAVVMSPDGVTWSWRDSGIESDLYGVAWGGGMFVAVGTEWLSSPHAVMFTSTDAITWTRRYTYPAYSFADSVVWDGSGFLVAGGYNTFWSTDGIEWRLRAALDPRWTARVAIFAGLQFVMAGSASGRGVVYTSAGGVDWTHAELDETSELLGAAFDGRQLVVVGRGGAIYTSPDGATWTKRTSGTTANLISVAWAGDRFVATSGTTIVTSIDGSTWTSATQPSGFSIGSLCWAQNQLVAVGSSIFTSRDGELWTLRGGQGSGAVTWHWLEDVAWSGTQFVAVGVAGTIMTSPDGRAWSDRSGESQPWLRGVAGGGGVIVAVGDSSTILTSADGVNWSPQACPVPAQLYGVAWDGRRFVAVGWDTSPSNRGAGVIVSSADGVAWHQVDSGDARWLSAITWSGSQFVAVGGGAVLTSTDGTIWTNVTRGLYLGGCVAGQRRVAGSGSRIVVVSDVPLEYGGEGFVLAGEDGASWTCTIVNSQISGGSFLGVTWDGAEFVAVGRNGLIATSVDGVTWTQRRSPAALDLFGVTATRDSVVAVGSGGSILRTDCTVPTRLRRHLSPPSR